MPAIRTRRDDNLLANWESMPERAPSLERADRPFVARILAMIGLFFIVLGGLNLIGATVERMPIALGTGWAIFLISIGVSFLIFHAFADAEMQFRRLYGIAGLALVFGGVALRLLAFQSGRLPWFFIGGVPGLFIGLILLVAVIRNETDAYFRSLMVNLIGLVGGLAILYSLGTGLTDKPPFNFLPGEGILLLILGTLYLGAFIGQQPFDSERGYYTAAALGVIGVIAFLIALFRSTLPDSNYLVPSGLLVMSMSTLFVCIALATCTDWPILVIARRDLAAYFYSPIAYLLFVGMLLTGWYMFIQFVNRIILDGPGGNFFEPIVFSYIFALFPVIVQMFIVPVLTMRLLSEEKRTGTLEVLMTAPVNEISVVVGKFVACWIFYMLTWLPWWLFLVGLRYFGGEEFDYRPVLSFMVAVGTIAGGLVSMGLFFSSLTSNQIVAAVLTFVGVIAHLALYFVKFETSLVSPGGAVFAILTYINFFDLWQNSLGGIIAPRYLLFHLSVTVFFLFATVKVLESRKWR